MTSCDLSDQTKGWKTTRKIAVRLLLPGEVQAAHPKHLFCAELRLAIFWGDRNLDHLRMTDGKSQRGAWTYLGLHNKSVADGDGENRH